MVAAKSDFVHLHVHTEYSLLDSTIRFDDLFKKAKEYHMPAIAKTDHGSLLGTIDFFQKAHREGLKPIIGCELYVAPKSRFDKSESGPGMKSHHLVVLVKSMKGYKNLLKLSSAGYLDGFYYHPRVDKELLEKFGDGLIATSACMQGEVASCLRRGNHDAAINAARDYQKIFGDENFCLEISDNGLPEQVDLNKNIIEIGRLLSIPIVATNNCHYTCPDDAGAHDVLLCMQAGKKQGDKNRMRFGANQFHLRSPDDMQRLFVDYPEAITNTAMIADKCNLPADLGKARLHFVSINRRSGNKGLQDIGRQLQREYGLEHVANLITFGRMRVKSAMRNIGRVLNIPPNDINTIVKIISDNADAPLRDLLRRGKLLQDRATMNKETEDLISIAAALEGLIFRTSIDANHMVVTEMPISENVPLRKDWNDNLVTQYSKRNVEAICVE